MNQKAFTKFGESVYETIEGFYPDVASNALKIDNTTEAVIVSGTTKAHIGLGNVNNYATKKTYTDGEALPATLYVVPKVARAIIAYLTKPFLGSAGKIQYVKTVNQQMAVEADYPILDICVCSGNDELNASLTAKLTQIVYERISNRLWKYDGTNYIEQPASEVRNYIKPNRWYVNRVTNRLYYARDFGLLVEF